MSYRGRANRICQQWCQCYRLQFWKKKIILAPAQFGQNRGWYILTMHDDKIELCLEGNFTILQKILGGTTLSSVKFGTFRYTKYLKLQKIQCKVEVPRDTFLRIIKFLLCGTWEFLQKWVQFASPIILALHKITLYATQCSTWSRLRQLKLICSQIIRLFYSYLRA